MSAKKDLIWYGLGALGIYLIWTKVSNTLTGPKSAFDATTTWLASLFPGTSPSVSVQGSVTLPGGSVVPMSTLQSNGFNTDGSSKCVRCIREFL